MGAGTESVQNRAFITVKPSQENTSFVARTQEQLRARRRRRKNRLQNILIPFFFFSRFATFYAKIKRKLRPVNYPLRLRMQQLYSSRLSSFSRQIFQNT